MIKESGEIVFFGGAGVSTESGIPDFRSSGGVFSKNSSRVSAEDILHIRYFKKHPAEFYRFYRERLVHRNAVPNAAHKKLAELERLGKVVSIVTQNIDGLHTAAGSQNVYEIHGSIHNNYCTICLEKFGLDFICGNNDIPKCKCGGTVRPNVTLYGENLDGDVLEQSIVCIEKADMMIVAGTSLQVYPAAGLLDYFKGSHLVLINKSETFMDGTADLIIREPVGEVMRQINI